MVILRIVQCIVQPLNAVYFSQSWLIPIYCFVLQWIWWRHGAHAGTIRNSISLRKQRGIPKDRSPLLKNNWQTVKNGLQGKYFNACYFIFRPILYRHSEYTWDNDYNTVRRNTFHRLDAPPRSLSLKCFEGKWFCYGRILESSAWGCGWLDELFAFCVLSKLLFFSFSCLYLVAIYKRTRTSSRCLNVVQGLQASDTKQQLRASQKLKVRES